MQRLKEDGAEDLMEPGNVFSALCASAGPTQVAGNRV